MAFWQSFLLKKASMKSPQSKTVHIYTSRKNVTICYETDICSAKPVLEDFEISVNDIFEV
jgi:hypothetical protein